MFPKIKVSKNHNNTLLLTFSPNESTWEFPNGKKLNLFNQLYYIIKHNNTEIYYNANLSENKKWDYHVDTNEVKEKVLILLEKWIEQGDLIIK